MPSSRINRTILFAIVIALLILTTIVLSPSTKEYYLDPWTGAIFGEGGVDSVSSSRGKDSSLGLSEDLKVIHGGVIMPKLENATAKAELGRAAWKLMHTMTLRYPENPTPDERDALKSYFYLSSRLYPCGECAQEFQKLLKEYPPQSSSRKVASLWLCHIHNLVNSRLNKPEFDCANLDATYDCGCGDAPLASEHPPNRKEPTKEDADTGLNMIKGGIGR